MLSLLSKLNPYMMWIKIGAAVVVVVAAFLAGVRWEKAACERDLFEQQQAEQAIIDQVREKNALLLEAQQEAREQAERRLAAANQKMIKESASAQRKIREFYSKYSGCRVSLERERLWRETNREVDSGVSETDPAPDRTALAGGGCTEADLHSNHADLVALYEQLKSKHSELQRWAKSALDVCNGKRNE